MLRTRKTVTDLGDDRLTVGVSDQAGGATVYAPANPAFNSDYIGTFVTAVPGLVVL